MDVYLYSCDYKAPHYIVKYAAEEEFEALYLEAPCQQGYVKLELLAVRLHVRIYVEFFERPESCSIFY